MRSYSSLVKHIDFLMLDLLCFYFLKEHGVKEVYFLFGFKQLSIKFIFKRLENFLKFLEKLFVLPGHILVI